MSDRILDRIRKLLAIADHANTGEHERDVALRQANSLMAKHAIDEALARAGQTEAERAKVERRSFDLIPDQESSSADLWHYMTTLLHAAAEANRCKVYTSYYGKSDIFGMADDLNWLEMLYTTIYFELVANVNPRWSADRSYEENVYAFKIAGYKWSEINDIARARGERDGRTWKRSHITSWDLSLGRAEYREYDEATRTAEQPTDKFHAMFRAYTKVAKARGDEMMVKSSKPEHYRLQFIEAFANRLVRRLREMGQEAAEAADSIPGAALALVSSQEDVNRAFWDAYPSYDPEVQARMAAEARRQRIAAEEERQAKLDAMSAKDRAKFLAAEQREQRAARGKVRYMKYDFAAQKLGAAAADKVNINRASKVAHTTKKEMTR